MDSMRDRRKGGMGKDKGYAPPFNGAPGVEDGQNINIPKDALGFSVGIEVFNMQRKDGGEGNFPGGFRDVVDNGAALPGNNRYSQGGGGGGIGKDTSAMSREERGQGRTSSEADGEDEDVE